MHKLPPSRPAPVSTPKLLARFLATIIWLAWAVAPVAGAGADAHADAARLARPGPHTVEIREVTVPSSDGGAFEARLYVPLPAEPVGGQAGSATIPIVAFGHGYLAPIELYASTLEHLASWGIAVIAPRSGGELFPDHERFAADLAAATDWVAVVAGTAADWPGPPVDPAARGVVGHSMGGGAAVLAAAMDPRIVAVATMAAADTRPSSVEAARLVEAPMLFIAASADRITPVDAHQRPMYEMARGPAQLRIISGGSHCGFLDRQILVGSICDEASIDVSQQRAHSRAALAAWLRTELAGDRTTEEVAWPVSPDAATEVEMKRTSATT